MSLSDQPAWLKALVLAGGLAATGGLLWYLLREGEDEEAAPEEEVVDVLFKVSDPAGAAIGIREGPDLNSPRTGRSLYNGQIFRVSQIVAGEGPQRFLQLADGQGWVFTHSGKDGRQLARECMPGEEAPPTGGMEQMMMEAQAFLAANPDMREQVMASPQFQSMLQDPAMLQGMMQQSAKVSQVLESRPELSQQFQQDPSVLIEALRR